MQLDKKQQAVATQYSHLRSPAKVPTFKEFCYPKKFALQPAQKFPAEYLRKGARGIFAFYDIGSGKTLTFIEAAEINRVPGVKPVIIMPASLIPNFYDECRFKYTGQIRNGQRIDYAGTDFSKLRIGTKEYRDAIERSNKLIAARYNVYSYNAFAMLKRRPKTNMVIIDEAQNVAGGGTMYNVIRRYIDANPDAKVILGTATPIFNSPAELFRLFTLLRVDLSPDRYTDGENLFHEEELRRKLSGIIAHYEGAPEHVYPQATIKIEKCRMSAFQARWYKSEIETELSRMGNVKPHEASNAFFIKSRQKANIVYPKGLAGTFGYGELTPARVRNSLNTYSCKFAKLLTHLRMTQPTFIYTSFTAYGGIKPLVKVLNENGFVDALKHGPGKRRYAIFSGDESQRDKQYIKDLFNDPRNDDCSQLQIIVGSPSIKEGVTLLRVRQVHILDPYWNHSRMKQIYGRAVRFCSHKRLASEHRDVKIYIYAAYADDPRLADPRNSIDMYILAAADEKKKINDKFIDLLKLAAVDRALRRYV